MKDIKNTRTLFRVFLANNSFQVEEVIFAELPEKVGELVNWGLLSWTDGHEFYSIGDVYDENIDNQYDFVMVWKDKWGGDAFVCTNPIDYTWIGDNEDMMWFSNRKVAEHAASIAKTGFITRPRSYAEAATWAILAQITPTGF